MEFFLPFNIPAFPFTINYRDPVFFIGSCFSEEIGNRMAQLKFPVCQNPNGILYNPLSIKNSMTSYLDKTVYQEEDLVEINGIFHSWQHHSVFSGIDKEIVLERINQSQNEANGFLKNAKIVVITFGTSYYYELKESGKVVANCHKAPPHLFEKKLLSIHQIEEDYVELIKRLAVFNPDLKIIFTVSPVRYIRDGIVEANRSKARLIEAVHSIISQTKNAFYFPSYELIADVLRDYRFYKNDWVHPNSDAVDYVFEKMTDSLLDKETRHFVTEMKSLKTAMSHRPLFEQSEVHQKFKETILNRIAKWEIEFQEVNFEVEKRHFTIHS